MGWKVFGCGLGFGVERFRIGLKVLGFGGGFLLCVFEIWLRVCSLGCLDSIEGLGFRVLDLIQSFWSGVF